MILVWLFTALSAQANVVICEIDVPTSFENHRIIDQYLKALDPSMLSPCTPPQITKISQDLDEFANALNIHMNQQRRIAVANKNPESMDPLITMKQKTDLAVQGIAHLKPSGGPTEASYDDRTDEVTAGEGIRPPLDE